MMTLIEVDAEEYGGITSGIATVDVDGQTIVVLYEDGPHWTAPIVKAAQTVDREPVRLSGKATREFRRLMRPDKKR